MSAAWHVMPIGDFREHEDSERCWCKPMLDPETELVWLHNSMDRREHTIEQGVAQ